MSLGLRALRGVYIISLTEGTCPTAKLRFPTAVEAAAALETAHLAALAGSARRRERRSYWCGHCGGHHLTAWANEPQP